MRHGLLCVCVAALATMAAIDGGHFECPILGIDGDDRSSRIGRAGPIIRGHLDGNAGVQTARPPARLPAPSLGAGSGYPSPLLPPMGPHQERRFAGIHHPIRAEWQRCVLRHRSNFVIDICLVDSAAIGRRSGGRWTPRRPGDRPPRPRSTRPHRR